MNTLADICAYCGAPSPETRDHIPPRGIFPSPRPSDLVTVPSCRPCNQGASARDERFLAYLSLQVGIDTPVTTRLWDQVLPGIRRNRRLHRRLREEVEPVWLATPSGIVHGRGYRALWDSDAHDSTIERMVRGLYFHHYGEVLGPRVEIKTHWFRELNDGMVEATTECEQRSVGEGQFVYRFGRASDAPLHSLWLFQFHMCHWAGGYTSPANTVSSTPPHAS
jgi:hypothetical protein